MFNLNEDNRTEWDSNAAIILLRVTPTAKRNSYRVARLVGDATQGSGLRPQPWAGESQLHYLSAPHCAAPVTFGSELLLLVPFHPLWTIRPMTATRAAHRG